MAFSRSFTGTPKFWNTFNITLPSIAANALSDIAIAVATFKAGAFGQVGPEDTLVAAIGDPATGAVARPAALFVSDAYFKNSDSKIHLVVGNATVGNYSAADVVTVRILAF